MPRRGRVLLGVVALCLLVSACGEPPAAVPTPTRSTNSSSDSSVGSGSSSPAADVAGLPGVRIDRRAIDFNEGSGAVASRRYPGVLWAIRDSGPSTPGGPRDALYAYKVADSGLTVLEPGRLSKPFKVQGAVNVDWEDIARDRDGNLWIADIGDNACQRDSVALLKVGEPDLASGTSARLLATYRFRYPDPKQGCKGRNAESLFLVGGVPYVISKASQPAVYRLPVLDPRRTVVARRVASLTTPKGGEIQTPTGADLSTDKRRLVVSNYAALFVYQSGNPSLDGDAFVKDMVGRPPRQVLRLGCLTCETASQVEGIAFSYDGYDLNLLSETRDVWTIPATAYNRG